MNIHILAGGPKEFVPDLNPYANETWVGVDKGVLYLINEGITPVESFGDFDSVTEEERHFLQTNTNLNIYPAEKDKTDLELALDWAIQQNPCQIKIFGATGGRLDHFLANVQLLSQPLNKNIDCELIDKQNVLTLKKPGTYNIEKNTNYPYVSFLPFKQEIKDLTLIDFKYKLKNSNISFGSTLCISNELINNIGTFSFKDGILMMIRSSDAF
ncbi:thiamine diphosphokinase [Bacillus timonensis]|nr:thiamine diphosphokinase [Bacillus timonensis]